MIKFKAEKWDERDLVERLALLVVGKSITGPTAECMCHPHGPDVDGLPPMPRKWQLDGGNNHWLHPQGDGVYLYCYRYWRADQMAALATVMKWLLFDVEILEVTQTSRYPDKITPVDRPF